MKDKTIAEAWVSYMDDVIPKDAPAVQIQESKRAFFGGAALVLQFALALGDDDVSEDEGVELLESLRRECEAFKNDVLEGRS
jgi:hypothetical protein